MIIIGADSGDTERTTRVAFDWRYPSVTANRQIMIATPGREPPPWWNRATEGCEIAACPSCPVALNTPKTMQLKKVRLVALPLARGLLNCLSEPAGVGQRFLINCKSSGREGQHSVTNQLY